MINVLFVCTGNTCRSPMAEGLFADLIRRWKIEGIRCESAGLAAFPGDAPSENAVRAAKEMGTDISSHRSRQLSMPLAELTDLFVCMTSEHEQAIKRAIPDAKTTVLSGGVSDPYCGDIWTYRKCVDKITDGFQDLVNEIRAMEKEND